MFSHPSELELIDRTHAAGCTVALHVLLVPLERRCTGFAHRVLLGVHTVPERKIREGFEQFWPLVAAGIVRADTARVCDDSTADGPVLVRLFAAGWPALPPRHCAGRGGPACAHVPLADLTGERRTVRFRARREVRGRGGSVARGTCDGRDARG